MNHTIYTVTDSFGTYPAQMVNVTPEMANHSTNKLFAIETRHIPNHLREAFVSRTKFNSESTIVKISNEEYARLRSNATVGSTYYRLVFRVYTKSQYEITTIALEQILNDLEQEIK